MNVFMPLPSIDFDPSEAAISWKVIRSFGHSVTFATPSGKQACGDQRMLTGKGLGIWRSLLMADENAFLAYGEMEKSAEFQHPISWSEAAAENFDGLLLPGGHAPGMIEYLESKELQAIVSSFFEKNQPVAAVCHGVILAARSKRADGKSVLYDKQTTSLLKGQELLAWLMTAMWLGSYYRTYPELVESEVRRSLKNSSQFVSGPNAIRRDHPKALNGFYVKDGNYISARWPGDVHTFATEFCKMLGGSH